MADNNGKRLRAGVLGCGLIAQAAQFESAAKPRNAELYAVCDFAVCQSAWNIDPRSAPNFDPHVQTGTPAPSLEL